MKVTRSFDGEIVLVMFLLMNMLLIISIEIIKKKNFLCVSIFLYRILEVTQKNNDIQIFII